MKQVDFSKGSIASNILKTSVPMLIAQILALLYNIVDRIYISRIPETGTAALGAVGLCFPIVIIVTAFTNLYGSGGSPIFSIARGKGDHKTAELLMNLSFQLELLTAVILTVVILLFGKNILTVFGADANAMRYAWPYLRVYILGTIFTMVASGMNPFINAQGYPGIGMLTVTIGAAANIILDPVFIFGMNMGITGAAVATVISQAVSAVFVLIFLYGKRPECRLHKIEPGRLIRERKQVGEITALGTASFVMQITNSLVQISCNRVLSDVGGHLYVSVMTIVSSVRQVLETPALAIADGTSPIISFNYGAGKWKRAASAVKIMFFMLMAYTGATWLLVVLKPEFFISIFSTDQALMKDAIQALHIYFFAFIFMSLQHTGQTVFKSLNKKKQAIFFSLLRKVFIVVPLTYILPYVFKMGTNGVFAAEPISNVIGGSASFFTMLSMMLPKLKERKDS